MSLIFNKNNYISQYYMNNDTNTNLYLINKNYILNIIKQNDDK